VAGRTADQEKSPRGTDSTGMDLGVLGRTVQEARKQQGLTVAQLSQRASVSAGLISQLERGMGNPSFLTMSRLADALEVPLGHFLQGQATPRRRLVRANERKKLVLPGDAMVYELLTPDLDGRLEVLRTLVPAGWTNRDQPFSHPGEECVHLLRGRLHVTIGQDSYELEEGDSVTYDCSVPHWWANRTDEDAVIIGAVTPPTF
jgi:transcriptional regulator with XRE-family HTH domain